MSRGDSLESILRSIADRSLCPRKYNPHYINCLRKHLQILKYIEDDKRTPVVLQKNSGNLYIRHGHSDMGPFSLDEGGFYNVGLAKGIESLIDLDVLEKVPVPLGPNNVYGLDIRTKYEKEIPENTKVKKLVEGFEKKFDHKKPFSHHDKKRIIPHFADRDNLIGIDTPLSTSIYHDSSIVEDKSLKNAIAQNKSDLPNKIKQENKRFRYPLALTYNILDKFKNPMERDLRRSKEDVETDDKEKNMKYLKRKARVSQYHAKELYDETDWILDKAGTVSGFVDLEQTSTEELLNGQFYIRKHYVSKESIKVNFKGDYFNSEHIPDFEDSIVAAGIFKQSQGELILNAATIYRIGKLPEEMIEILRNELIKINTDATMKILHGQINIESLLQIILEYQDLEPSERSLLREALETIRTVGDDMERCSAFINFAEENKHIWEIIVESIEDLNLDIHNFL